MANQPTIYPILKEFSKHAYIDKDLYETWYARSLKDPENFWSEQAKEFISWSSPWDKALSGDFQNLNVQWFTGGKLNACYNCVDRHLPKRANQTAIIWEGNDPEESLQISYSQLHEQICRFANVLKKYGVQKGDRVCIYMPMVPETIIAMLACARIGAVHSVLFAGFSSAALKERILDADCQLVITANEVIRGNKMIPLKANVDEALKDCPGVKTVIVIKRNENSILWKNERDVWYHECINTVSSECPCEVMDANDPLYILYTAGSTAKPKRILHVTGGYLLYAAITYKYIFNYQEGDIYWCTADMGWITGHSYGVYGPLCNGATSVLFEGTPDFPTPARYWETIDKHQVNIFYTAPTFLRMLRREGDKWLAHTHRKSLKLLGSVGEAINPKVWQWYYEVVGNSHCPIVDTWWQTETGGILIAPLPGAMPLKPGSAAKPFFGIAPVILDDEGNAVTAGKTGKLAITQPWPGMLNAVCNNSELFSSYFKKFPGNYLTGDNARCDEEGYFWITGRNDDVIKISDHRISSGEVESALLEHPSVAEAGVVGVSDEAKGEGIYAFVTLKTDVQPNEQLRAELIRQVRHSIGTIATPDYIQWADGLPKTRSGKIMRRLLQKIANNDLADLGDISTLAEPQIVDSLIDGRKPWAL